MFVKHLAVPVVALGLVGVGFADSAEAAHKVKTKVTITAVHTDFSGKVKSKKPATCAAGRTVYLILQVGKRGGGNDQLFATDTAEWESGAYRYHFQDYDHPGKFYTKVLPTSVCKGAKSRTVKATRASS
jgi:hypothetical protein